jgi:outer membrane protein OmpA-like peptidoglycan-associated protein
VIVALTKDHDIKADRLAAEGVGPLAPVANNTDDAGRAKNRRVEMVLR